MTTPPSTSRAPLARPFLLPGNDTGVLIVHGLGGSVAEYRSFAEMLNQAGYTVSGMMVAGHGGSPADLARTTPTDWAHSVQAAYQQLQTTCQTIIVLGVSYGAVLAVYLALHQPNIGGLILVNPATSYRGGGKLQNILLRLIRLVRPTIPKRDLTPADHEAYRQTGSLTAWPITSILQSTSWLKREVQPHIAELGCPVLVCLSKQDRYVQSDQAAQAFRTIKKAILKNIPSQTHRPFREPAGAAWLSQETLSFLAGLKK